MNDYVARHIEPLVSEAMDRARIVVIIGASGVGKSTLAQRMAQKRGIRFMDLSHAQIYRQALRNPRGFIHNLSQSGGVIDEFQELPELVEVLRECVNQDQSLGRFLITGTVDLLRNRVSFGDLFTNLLTVELYSLSQGELERLDLPCEFFHLAFTDSFVVGQEWSDLGGVWPRIFRGGRPGSVLAVSLEKREEDLRDYAGDVLNRFVEEGFDSFNPDGGLIHPFVKKLSRESGCLFNPLSIGSEFQEKKEVVEIWFGMLERLSVMCRVSNWDDDHSNPLKNMIKGYILDCGFICFINKWGKVLNAKQIGTLFESFVFSELTYQKSFFFGGNIQIYYYRNSSNIEVDLVLVRGDFIVGVEVKSSSSPRWSDFKGLRYLRTKMGARFVCGVVIYNGNTIRSFGEQLYAVPVSMFWSSPQPTSSKEDIENNHG